MISDFPILTWLIFPVTGYIFGKVHIRIKDKRAFYRIISPAALLVPLIYFPIGIHFGWGMFGEGQNCYYHMMIWDVAVCMFLNIGMLGLWNLMSRYFSNSTKAFFFEVSNNITAIYCIHWVFVRAITNVILYIKNGTQILTLWETMLLSLAILIVSIAIAHYYKILKAGFLTRKTERISEQGSL